MSVKIPNIHNHFLHLHSSSFFLKISTQIYQNATMATHVIVKRYNLQIKFVTARGYPSLFSIATSEKISKKSDSMPAIHTSTNARDVCNIIFFCET